MVLGCKEDDPPSSPTGPRLQEGRSPQPSSCQKGQPCVACCTLHALTAHPKPGNTLVKAKCWPWSCLAPLPRWSMGPPRSHKPPLFPALRPISRRQQQAPRCSRSGPEPCQRALARIKVRRVWASRNTSSPLGSLQIFSNVNGFHSPPTWGGTQNRALCVRQISSPGILLGAWVLSGPWALAGPRQP